jgi:hypothetical protein
MLMSPAGTLGQPDSCWWAARSVGRSSHVYPARTGTQRHLVASGYGCLGGLEVARALLSWCLWWWQVLGSNQRRLSRRFYSETAASLRPWPLPAAEPSTRSPTEALVSSWLRIASSSRTTGAAGVLRVSTDRPVLAAAAGRAAVPIVRLLPSGRVVIQSIRWDV